MVSGIVRLMSANSPRPSVDVPTEDSVEEFDDEPGERCRDGTAQRRQAESFSIRNLHFDSLFRELATATFAPKNNHATGLRKVVTSSFLPSHGWPRHTPI
jgi:hypothetical protein